MRSRRFSVKLMFMGFVWRPRHDKLFDSRVHQERVSKTHVVKKEIAH